MDYAKRNLPVLWIEADPRMMPVLQANLRGFPNQISLEALLGDRFQEGCDFHIANNEGASSSLYPFDQAHRIWPELDMRGKLLLTKLTLPQALAQAGISLASYDTLILDVQGAEMGILQGIGHLPNHFRQIQLETSNFPVYRGAPLRDEIDEYLAQLGYLAVESRVFAAAGQDQCMDCRYVLTQAE